MKRSQKFTRMLPVTLAAGCALVLALIVNAVAAASHAPHGAETKPPMLRVTKSSQAKTCQSIGFPPNRKSTLPADFPAPPAGISRCGQHGDQNIFLNRDGWNFDEILEHYRNRLRAQGYRAVITGRRLQFSHRDDGSKGTIWSATPTDPPVGYRITYTSYGE
jgi:hypothetical protein